MRAEALQLPVRAELHAAAGVGDLFRAARDEHVVEVGLRRHQRGAASARRSTSRGMNVSSRSFSQTLVC